MGISVIVLSFICTRHHQIGVKVFHGIPWRSIHIYGIAYVETKKSLECSTSRMARHVTYLNHSTNSNIWRCLFVKLPSHRFGTLHRQVSFLLSSTREMSLFNFLSICPPCSDTRDTRHFIIIIKVESFFTTGIIPSIPDDHKDKWYLHVYCISVNITTHPNAVQPQCTPATWQDRNFFKFFIFTRGCRFAKTYWKQQKRNF